MTNFDDGESFAVGDDDPRNTTYNIDVEQFRRFARERLVAVRQNIGDDFEPRIFADRVAARLSPTYQGIVTSDKVDIQERIQVVLDEIEDDFLRARVARAILELLQLLTDVRNEDEG